MTSSSFQFLPLFPVFDYSFECHILSLHQFAQQVRSFPTCSSLPLQSSPDYIMQTINLWSSGMLNMLEHCGTHTERVTSNTWKKFK